MNKAQEKSIQRSIRELKKLEKLKEKFSNDRDRYEVAEQSAREQKEFWHDELLKIERQIEAYRRAIPEESLT